MFSCVAAFSAPIRRVAEGVVSVVSQMSNETSHHSEAESALEESEKIHELLASNAAAFAAIIVGCFLITKLIDKVRGIVLSSRRFASRVPANDLSM